MAGKRWSDEEIQFLKFAYPNKDFTTEDISKALSRSIRSINIKSMRLGLKKYKEILEDDLKRCSKCNVIYNKKFFSTCGNGRLHSWCNYCLNKRYNKNINNETDDVETDDVETDDVKTKKCTKCGEIKKMTDFYKDKTSPSGRLAYCKKCRNKQVEDYKIRKMKERGW